MWVAWREGTLTRAEELEALCSWVGAKNSRKSGWRKANVEQLNRLARKEWRTAGRLHGPDVIAPGVWITFLLILGFFARPLLIPGVVIGTFVLGIFYAARDADLHA